MELDREKAKIAQHTKRTTVWIYPTMLAATIPVIIMEEEYCNKTIQFNLLNYNHNVPNSSKGYEIMNNMLDNPMQIKVNHERSLGGNGQLVVIQWNKVCYDELLDRDDLLLHFVKYYHPCDTVMINW